MDRPEPIPGSATPLNEIVRTTNLITSPVLEAGDQTWQLDERHHAYTNSGRRAEISQLLKYHDLSMVGCFRIKYVVLSGLTFTPCLSAHYHELDEAGRPRCWPDGEIVVRIETVVLKAALPIWWRPYGAPTAVAE